MFRVRMTLYTHSFKAWKELKYIKVNNRLLFQTVLDKHLEAETLFLHHNHLNTQPTGVFMESLNGGIHQPAFLCFTQDRGRGGRGRGRFQFVMFPFGGGKKQKKTKRFWRPRENTATPGIHGPRYEEDSE